MPPDHDGLPGIDSIAPFFPAFEFEGMIARSEAGAVYKARQRSLDRDVAIRILPRDQGNDPAFRNSFDAGMKAMASLAHPSLIRVYDSGEVDGLTYLIMEYVAGESLHHSSHGKAIDARQAAQIVIAACQGLAHAHGNGIIHRAINPTHILLTPKCEPKIGNFGFTERGTADAAYMAPELADGGASENPQSDVYAIGVILRELLTGIPAGTVDAEMIVISNPDLDGICRNATHSDPAQRYHNAAALAEALKRWLAAGDVMPFARRHPQAAVPRPRPAAVTRRKPRAGRSLLRNCAVIGFLLITAHGMWGVYQEKKENLARLQQADDAKPRVSIVKTDAEKEAPEAMNTAIVQWESEP